MKRTLTILAAILLMAVGATAQKLSYSAVVRNSANELVANANITVAVSVTDGVNTYTESHAATTNANGLVTLTIGEGAGATGSLSGMNWPAASITATYTLPDGATVTNTVPVNAVPYALYAETAGSGGGGGIVTETDPTVPAWAKEPTKPAYDYSEITNTPTIPTVNDGTLTIQKNGAEVGTFTANQSGNTTVNITITAQDIIDAVNGMTDAEKAALCSALNCGGGSEPSDPTAFTCGTSKMVDADGNEYETVLIGTQCWTKTNLRVAPAGATDATSSGAYSYTEPYYYVKPGVDAATNGYYYNWEAAKLACPSGWHLPSDAEWNTLEATVSGSDWQESYVTATAYRGSHAGKLAGDGWSSSSTAGAPGNAADANHNASGFSAVPGGYWLDGFYGAGFGAYFWSSTESGSNSAWNRGLTYGSAGVGRNYNYRGYGFSVRCLRDETGGGTTYVQPTVTTSAATSVTQTSAMLNGEVSNPDGVTITAQGFEWKATTGGTYTAVNATGETMTYNLTGLTAGTSYTYRAFVTTAEGTAYGSEVDFTTTSSAPTVFTCGTSKMTDADGNEYETVQIGTQCWTKTNMRTTTSAVASAAITDATSSGAYSYTEPYYYVKPGVDAATNGYYYNWEAAKLACPSGWHLPSDAEWNTLEATVSGSDWQESYVTATAYRGSHAGKLAGDGWSSSSTAGAPGNAADANHNASGFSAVPAGYWDNGFNFAGFDAYFWPSTESGADIAWYRDLYYNIAGVYRSSGYRNYGLSVRCLRD